MPTLYLLRNCTSQVQELAVPGRPKISPGGSSPMLAEATFRSPGVQRLLAQGRFTVVKRWDVSPPSEEPEVPAEPDEDEQEEGDKPRRRRGAEKRS